MGPASFGGPSDNKNRQFNTQEYGEEGAVMQEARRAVDRNLERMLTGTLNG